MSIAKKIIIVVTVLLCLALIGTAVFFIVKENEGYDMKFTVEDTLPDGEGKRARVILLAGQSNASGCSRDDYLKKNVTEEKYEEYKSGYDNVYINYFATGTNQSSGFVKCATMQGEAGGYFGPELGLAEKLHEMYPDEQFFIIKYAWGGSNLFEQWLSPSSFGKTGNLYKAFVCYVEQSMEYLISKNYDVEIEGICWMQGESDSLSPKNAADYESNLTNFIKDLRERFDRYAADDGIAFVDAYIADNPMFWVYCDIVNESKRAVASKLSDTALIDTNAADLTCAEEPEGQPDIAHYDSMSQIKLGHLFAEELSRFLN